jgi:hypothetical protein
MNYEKHSRLIKWTVAATAMILPIACSSTSGTGSLTGPGDSGTTSQQGQDSGSSSTQPTDSGNTSTQPTDSGVAPTDTGTVTDVTAPPTDGNLGAGSFSGMFACTLTGMAMAANMNVSLPLDAELTASETGMAISAQIVSEAGLSCTVDFTDQGGGVATINPGQSCMVPVTTPIMTTATLTFVATAGNDAGPPGKVTLANGTITTNLPFDLSALGGVVTGTGVLTGNCIKN